MATIALVLAVVAAAASVAALAEARRPRPPPPPLYVQVPAPAPAPATLASPPAPPSGPALGEADVARMVAAALDAYRAGADHERLLATALLEQMAHEVLTRTPYDAGQRRLAVEQRLRRAYNRLGASPPADLLETVRRMS